MEVIVNEIHRIAPLIILLIYFRRSGENWNPDGSPRSQP